MNMRAEIAAQAYRGRTASIVLLTGHLCVSILRHVAGVQSVRLDDEEGALRTALASAGQQIATLARTAGGEAAQNPRIPSCFAGR